MEELEDYMYDHFIDYEIVGSVVKISEEYFIYIDGDHVMDETLSLMLSATDSSIASKYQDKNPSFLFKFGGRYYTRPCDEWNKLVLIPFVMKGESIADISMDFVHLGVHGKYELMNGTRDYSDWCKKARFFNQDTLGICEKNTLAGALLFQQACIKNKIKPIIGVTFRVMYNTDEYQLKMFVKDNEGWLNLLKFSKICNVDNVGYINHEDIVLKSGKGVICVIMPTKHLSKELIDTQKKAFDTVYFQIDMSEYEYEEKELEVLNSTKLYIDEFSEYIQPIMINDSYYLEKEDARIKRELNKSGVKGEYASSNQHYKHIQELYLEWECLWSEDKKHQMMDIFKRSVRNTLRMSMQCEFKINTDEVHLPKYEMTEEESKMYKDEDDMIDKLVEEGVKKLIDPSKYDMDVVWDRIDMEMEVIRAGGFVAYFLITRDIINWSKSNKILTGVGRGCFSPGQNVMMFDGKYKNIEDVKRGDVLYNHFTSDNKGEVVKLWEYDVDEDLVVLDFGNGTVIECTKDHKIYTNNRGWVEADMINEDDDVCLINNKDFVN